MKLKELLRAIHHERVIGVDDVEVTGVTHDSRRIKPGGLFVAVPGHRLDGSGFVAEAQRRGASVVVLQPSALARLPAGGPTQVVVSDARLALAEAALRFHDNPARRMHVTGVTGTNGKTTVTFMQRTIFRHAGWTTGLVGTVRYDVGTRSIPATRTTPEASDLQALLAEMVQVGCRAAVMEVSSHALHQRRVWGIPFDVAVFTNLTREHLDYHGDMEHYFEAKARLFDDLGGHGKKATAVVNGEDAWGRKLRERIPSLVEVITFGEDARAQIRAEKVDLGFERTSFLCRTPWGDAAVTMPAIGRFNVMNALAALAACGAAGIPLPAATAALATGPVVPGRLESIPTGRGFRVFVDYAHTDDALNHVLRMLRSVTARRLILVFGCGGDRDRTKRRPMGEAAARWADYTVLTSDNPRGEDPRSIIDEIVPAFGADAVFEIEEDRRAAIRKAILRAGEGDAILVAGKGHENVQEFRDTVVPFDDREVVRLLLQELS